MMFPLTLYLGVKVVGKHLQLRVTHARDDVDTERHQLTVTKVRDAHLATTIHNQLVSQQPYETMSNCAYLRCFTSTACEQLAFQNIFISFKQISDADDTRCYGT